MQGLHHFNLFPHAHPLIAEVDVARVQYYHQGTVLDRIALSYGQQPRLLKGCIKYLMLGLSVFSLFAFSVSMTLGWVICSAFIVFLEAHYNAMERRCSETIALKRQLATEVKKGEEVLVALTDAQKKAEQLKTEISAKEREIETVRVQLNASAEEMVKMMKEMEEIKKTMNQKARDFSSCLSSTEDKLSQLCASLGL